MNHDAAVLNAMALVCIAGLTACAALSGHSQARHSQIIVKIPVRYADLDVSQPAGAQELYYRLQHAALVACTNGDQVALEPLANPAACYEDAIAEAVRTVKQPQLTVIYLRTHTLQAAATHGIKIPDQVAAKWPDSDIRALSK